MGLSGLEDAIRDSVEDIGSIDIKALDKQLRSTGSTRARIHKKATYRLIAKESCPKTGVGERKVMTAYVPRL